MQGRLLKAIFVSRYGVVGHSADNIRISPGGGLLFCEHGGNGGNGGPYSAAIAAQDVKVLHPNGSTHV